jgi:N-sulfoglucosamine sulfohydrolase
MRSSSVLALIFLLGRAAIAVAAPARPPNLLVITADDMNADSPGWMGNPLHVTPRLDALAASSHRFVNANVTVAICQPSRSTLLTGRVPHRNGALGFEPIDLDVPTLVEVLRDRDYLTAAFNKLSHMQPPSKFPWDIALADSGRKPHELDAQLRRSMDAADRDGRPFFVLVNATDPHRPFRDAIVAPEAVPLPGILEDLPGVRRDLAKYFSGVARLDTSVGAVLDTLDAAGHGDDTIVVFLSDHGFSFPFAKTTVYRNGTWSPALVRYPGMTPPATHEEMVSSVDVMPTVLELLAVAPPPGMDGRSWGPLLRGETEPEREFVVTHVNSQNNHLSFPQRCIRTRTRSLIFQAWADSRTRFRAEVTQGLAFRTLMRAARTDERIDARMRQFVFGVPLAFYDLERDPDERNDVIDDPAYGPEVARLADALDAEMERTRDPQLESFRSARGRR